MQPVPIAATTTATSQTPFCPKKNLKFFMKMATDKLAATRQPVQVFIALKHIPLNKSKIRPATDYGGAILQVRGRRSFVNRKPR
jgi:hypothetical protein